LLNIPIKHDFVASPLEYQAKGLADRISIFSAGSGRDFTISHHW